MTDDNSTVIANGAVGMTGLTRATAVLGTAGTSAIFTLPNTFILKGYIPAVIKADGSAGVAISALSVSTGQVTVTLASSCPVGTEIILFGILGRRDQGPRTAANYMNENPNTEGRP